MPDDDKNQDALMDKFLERITPKLTESILESVTAKVEEQVGGVVAKNQELLAKLKDSKDQSAELTKLIEGAQRELDARAGKTQEKPEAVTISKTDARDVRKYQAAKQQAAEASVPLQIVREG